MTRDAISTRILGLVRHPLFPAVALSVLATTIILGAWGFQILGGLKPCPLCLEQRVPWYVLIAVGCVIASAQWIRAPRVLVMGLFALAALLAVWSATQGLYHAGIEYQWWEGPPTCTTDGGGVDLNGGLNGLSTSDIIMCDVVPWSMLGISLAGFNFLFSLLAIALAGWGLRMTLTEVR